VSGAAAGEDCAGQELRHLEDFMADEQSDIRALVQELAEERRRREGLEQRVNELQAVAQEAEWTSAIRTELQRLGVSKVELAFKAVKDDLKAAKGDEVKEYLARFVGENPELLPARLGGGSGASAGHKSSPSAVDLDKIRPGMSAEEMERVRQEIARVASQTLRGM
jgi:hypothetical protein